MKGLIQQISAAGRACGPEACFVIVKSEECLMRIVMLLLVRYVSSDIILHEPPCHTAQRATHKGASGHAQALKICTWEDIVVGYRASFMQ